MINIKGLKKRFGRLEVLKELDAQIQENTITAIVGHNGSGKTTLIKCMLGLDKYDGGDISIKDFKLNGDWNYRSQIGYMPQVARFPENLTASEVITMISDLRTGSSTQAEELISYFRLVDEMEKPLKTLSGGTRQKVNAIVALMFNPDILILDEPTAGLDPVSSSLLKDKINAEKTAGKTVIITSHIMSEIQELADTILYLLDGKIFFDGPVDDLIAQTGEKNLERAIAKMMS
ncbi:MAG: ABC transporter ATP-binding protein [FCB group bacterium]|nr:ABC transporter ATP-binding protein [FCB group bacterium]MBL7029334.1 ABC transporter ATP-binding protein [Candidatus Neomarinimicrobiota bacterium]MBL7120731.1 ABC transporter ATP-binding protein [Candidatus Neomarinimicrobiota bacterium]